MTSSPPVATRKNATCPREAQAAAQQSPRGLIATADTGAPANGRSSQQVRILRGSSLASAIRVVPAASSVPGSVLLAAAASPAAWYCMALSMLTMSRAPEAVAMTACGIRRPLRRQATMDVTDSGIEIPLPALLAPPSSWPTATTRTVMPELPLLVGAVAVEAEPR